MKAFLREQGMYLSFAIALVATLGSLYFSEIMKFPPCAYCWYQRILMYPLVIILGIASVRKDTKQTLYVLPFTVLGMLMSGYHYLTQKFSFFTNNQFGTCGPIPCNAQYIDWLGFITIPFLAFVAFTLIFVIQLLLWKINR